LDLLGKKDKQNSPKAITINAADSNYVNLQNPERIKNLKCKVSIRSKHNSNLNDITKE